MTKINNGFIEADLGLDFINAGTTTRGLDLIGPSSQSPYDLFNLGEHVQDNVRAVTTNRLFLEQQYKLPNPPCWLQQVHGTDVVEMPSNEIQIVADASFTRLPKTVLAIMTADCLPVILASEDADWIAVVHCGWRSLAAGILSKTVASYPKSAAKIRAWLGPAIGPKSFQVGEDVKAAFQYTFKNSKLSSRVDACFVQQSDDKYLADLSALAKLELSNLGLIWIKGSDYCTYLDPINFFSYRRDGVTGRMATIAWIQ